MALTPAEIEVYDRQIRFWGLEAQAKISQSLALIIGLNPTNIEVCKDLAAAGVNLILCDDRPLSEICTPIVLLPAAVSDDRNNKTVSIVEIRFPTRDYQIAEEVASRVLAMNSFVKVETVKFATGIDPELLLKSNAVILSSTIYPEFWIILKDQQETQPLESLKQLQVVHFVNHNSAIAFLHQSDSEYRSGKFVELLAQKVEDEDFRIKISVFRDHLENTSRDTNDEKISVAAILGGVIAQECREAICGGKKVADWNACVYRETDSSLKAEFIRTRDEPPKPRPAFEGDVASVSSSNEE